MAIIAKFLDTSSSVNSNFNQLGGIYSKLFNLPVQAISRAEYYSAPTVSEMLTQSVVILFCQSKQRSSKSHPTSRPENEGNQSYSSS